MEVSPQYPDPWGCHSFKQLFLVAGFLLFVRGTLLLQHCRAGPVTSDSAVALWKGLSQLHLDGASSEQLGWRFPHKLLPSLLQLKLWVMSVFLQQAPGVGHWPFLNCTESTECVLLITVTTSRIVLCLALKA